MSGVRPNNLKEDGNLDRQRTRQMAVIRSKILRAKEEKEDDAAFYAAIEIEKADL